MLKIISSFFAGVVVVAILAWQFGGGMMVREYPSPYGLTETAARIQHNIKDAGWSLSGLRSPSNTIRRMGATVPNVLLIEACSPDYSKQKRLDSNRILRYLTIRCKTSGSRRLLQLQPDGHRDGPSVPLKPQELPLPYWCKKQEIENDSCHKQPHRLLEANVLL